MMRSSVLQLGPLALLAACATTDGTDADDTGAVDDDVVMLARTVSFAEAEDGVSVGFDLDGGDAAAGCGIEDLTSPDGTPGIDNAFGLGLLPVITAVGGQALPELVQNAVTDGELLIMLELDGYDEAAPGDCIPTRVLRGWGEPVMGGGEILPGQTFDQNPKFPVGEIACARKAEDGSVQGDGFDYRLPLAVFDESIDLSILDASFKVWPTETGWSGLIGGGVSTAEIAANVQGFDAIPSSLVNGVVSALDLWADLAPEAGSCTQVSVTIAFDAVPAYLYDGEPPPLPDTGDTGGVVAPMDSGE